MSEIEKQAKEAIEKGRAERIKNILFLYKELDGFHCNISAYNRNKEITNKINEMYTLLLDDIYCELSEGSFYWDGL